MRPGMVVTQTEVQETQTAVVAMQLVMEMPSVGSGMSSSRDVRDADSGGHERGRLGGGARTSRSSSPTLRSREQPVTCQR